MYCRQAKKASSAHDHGSEKWIGTATLEEFVPRGFGPAMRNKPAHFFRATWDPKLVGAPTPGHDHRCDRTVRAHGFDLQAICRFEFGFRSPDVHRRQASCARQISFHLQTLRVLRSYSLLFQRFDINGQIMDLNFYHRLIAVRSTKCVSPDRHFSGSMCRSERISANHVLDEI